MLEIESRLEDLKERRLLRALRFNAVPLSFASNDYLGLSNDVTVRVAVAQELMAGCPLGATGSRLLSGQTVYHERVEKFIRDYFFAQASLLFSSGFSANLAVMASLGSEDTEYFSDEFNHASLIDGMKSTKSLKSIFRHNDVNHLEDLLRNSKAKRKVIVTESVFSMQGDLSPLFPIYALAERFGAWLVVDEAHATGIFGQNGIGRVPPAWRKNPKLVSIHTAGKAIGGQGAFILSHATVREWIINEGRSFIYSTALSPLLCVHIEHALRKIQAEGCWGEQVLKTAENFQQDLLIQRAHRPSGSQVFSIVMGSNEKALEASHRLTLKGIDVRAIRYPTVPKGQEGIRIGITRTHTPEDLRLLNDSLMEVE